MIELRSLACLLLSATLVACGGGGGSSSSEQAAITPPAADDPSSDPDSGVPGDGIARATLVWTAPVQREDGSALVADEIAGYEIYHIEDASGDMDVIEVGGDSSEYDLELATGSHQLGIAVVDVYGTKSQMSELQTVEVN